MSGTDAGRFIPETVDDAVPGKAEMPLEGIPP